jgi:anhydro-N-acetylmuramic acid kinase
MNKYLNFSISDVRMIVSGGGIHHLVLMKDIQKYTRISEIKTVDNYGIQPDFKEALLMAVLGVAHIQKMTANMPTVTGAKKMVVLGSVIQNSCLSCSNNK